MPEKKYITINGVMKKNPAYVDPNNPSIPVATAISAPNVPLAIVSSLNDTEIAQEVQASQGITVPTAPSTNDTIDMLQDDEMLANYKSRIPLEGGEIIEKLGKLFEKYETPLGMINKLMMLTEYKLDFIIDDSGSMSLPTDVSVLDATEPVKTLIANRLNRTPKQTDKMSRLEEAEDRLHIMLDILAYIPIEHIQIRFLNASAALTLERSGKTPDEFQNYAHQTIRERFSKLKANGSTPVQAALNTGFNYSGKWSHYLFNDGEPNEGGKLIRDQICARENPENHPLTLISCTNRDEETAWMKQVDAEAKYVAEIDDFNDEKNEIAKKQGPAFPYTRGLWILCQLVSSINPFDLDALDENLPLTRYTMSNILGRQLNPVEYQYYFERNPNAALYVREYARFLNEEIFAQEIIPSEEQRQREQRTGYKDGERPTNALLINISSQLNPITAIAQQRFAEQNPAEHYSEQPANKNPSNLLNNSIFPAVPAPKETSIDSVFKKFGSMSNT